MKKPTEMRTPTLLEKLGPCAKCGYDARGISSPRCPECGNTAEVIAASTGTDAWTRRAMLIVAISGIAIGSLVFVAAVCAAVFFGVKVQLPIGAPAMVLLDAAIALGVCCLALGRVADHGRLRAILALVVCAIAALHAFRTAFLYVRDTFMFISI